MVGAELPPERLAELRQLIQNRVSGEAIREQIRGCVTATLCAGEEEGRGGGGRVSEGEVLRTLEERGVVDEVMESLNLGSDGVRGDVIGGDGVRGDGVRGDVEPLPSTFLGDEGSPQRGELHLYLHIPFSP